ncbi:CRISPR-associated protein Cas4 [Clostridium sp. AM58-1XD]|uniref:CRISPR-associated protein Cas4 n=1 Tax=Clostridium sp. AM58-1XD TaxID=2292307 RepID=UPI000E545BCE|nr:CRISPR-associated protein Cas4 [Clostridium sp. AM58-1XD]RGY96762.1 CRISPR-associated protein Cas4 [Clostridium sp. AM58-1XD]
MEYGEDDYLMLSGIQHFAFCRRQWALIHIEQQWAENERTIAGELLHKNAHDPYFNQKRSDVIISRGMPVFSRKMGISGECDIVEFRKADDGISLYGHRGLYEIYPIEYKKGKPKDTEIDVLQLTAQAMCLEEMLTAKIDEGAIFYGEIKRRDSITFTDELRSRVKGYFEEMHQLYDRRYTPRVKWSKGCNACSLKDVCMPKLGKVSSVREYIQKAVEEDCL